MLYDHIDTIYQFIKSFLDKKKPIFEGYGAFKPQFYIVKLGFTGLYIFFLIFRQKHRLWLLVRIASPRRGGSNDYLHCEAVLTSTHNLCFEQKYEKISEFLSENFQFLEVKFSICLNRRVFVMHVWWGIV